MVDSHSLNTGSSLISEMFSRWKHLSFNPTENLSKLQSTANYSLDVYENVHTKMFYDAIAWLAQLKGQHCK